MLLSNTIIVEEDKSLNLYVYGPEWQTVTYKKRKNSHAKKLLAETLEEALTAQQNTPGLDVSIDPVKWTEAYNKVLEQHFSFLTSFSDEEITTKIDKLKKSENKHERESTYIQFDCRKYLNGKELDMMVLNGYKFITNRFYGNSDFVDRVKKHYRSKGYNCGFAYHDENGVNKYTHLKIYFKRR